MISQRFSHPWLLGILIACGSPDANALDFADILEPGSEPALLEGDVPGGPYRFTEGPAYPPDGGYWLFSDIPNSRIMKRLADGTTSEFFKPSGEANGLLFDGSGRLYACQGGARQVVRFEAGTATDPVVLADSFDGKKLNSPNDIVLDDHGGFYFTDPRYGSKDNVEQTDNRVYYVDPAGKITSVVEKLGQPNGILLSPDGKYLYVAETNHRQLHRFNVVSPGEVTRTRLTYTAHPELDRGGPDGMAMDIHGNIYATYRPITVFTPDLEVIGRISVPKGPANCAFGGKDNSTMFITAKDSLYSVRLKVSGLALRTGSPQGGTTSATGESTATQEVTFGSLKLKVPVAWKQREPKSRMRVGELEVPAAKGDKESAVVVAFYFGPGGAGTVDANAERWMKQFAADERKVDIYEGKSPTGAYTVVDVSGTYNKSVGPPVLGKKRAVPGSRVVNVMLETKEGAYFLKLEGLALTVSSAVDDLIRSFGGTPKKSAGEARKL
jgi:gluconolactonase